jgi:hypothetical protein
LLSIFRSNQIFTALPLLLYVCLTHIGALSGHALPENVTVPPSMLYYNLFGWVSRNTLLSAWVAVGLVFVQAILINLLADRYRLLQDRNWIVGAAYVLISAAVPDFLYVSPALVATTFVSLSLSNIFNTYKSSKATKDIFDAAFWVGVAALFYPPALYLLVAAFAGLSVMRSFKLQEQLVFFTGVFCPLFLVWLFWFWMDSGAQFRSEQFWQIFSFYHFKPDLHLSTLLKWGLLIFLFILATLSSNSFAGRKGIFVQKMMTTLFWFLTVAALSVFFQNDPMRSHFMLTAPTVGICLAMPANAIRNRMLAELLHLFLLGFILFIQFFPIQ